MEHKYDSPRLPTFEECSEQERLHQERERLMEVTRELARMKKEMEEQRLKELYKPLVEKAREKIIRACQPDPQSWEQLKNILLESNPLFYIGVPAGSSLRHSICITSKGLYKLVQVLLKDQPRVQYKLAPMYIFDKPLDDFGLSLIKQLDNGDLEPYSLNAGGSILSRMFDSTWQMSGNTRDARRKFESVIRLIPGEYRNGSWRQLDGFFGVYYNPDTNTIQEEPPV